MFNGIGDINWATLKQAHGFADHVPEAIKGLISDDEKEQESSYWRLDNYVVLQGDLYQSAFYVIPFLIEVVNSEVKSGRAYVYDLLIEISNGYAVDDVLCVFDGEEYPLGEACKRAIGSSYKSFLAEISDLSSNCRESALDLLISIEDNQDEIISELLVVRGRESDDQFRRKIDEAVTEIRLKKDSSMRAS
ncbi:hypothetical protein [Chitinivorax sp. B]|uniref:hypothetical protein n=1 Tax=Chitinivorax sp. B TaxID=2502235 RepID=UPI0010FA3162|nr:hypothetical protein [Chitinivorax sp. B]